MEQTWARYPDAWTVGARAGNDEGRWRGLPAFGSGRRRSAAGDAPGLHELVAPVAVDQPRHHDVLAGARGMHEAAVAQVDADLVAPLAPAAEEHPVAVVHFVTFDLLAPVRPLPRDARRFDAQRTSESISDTSAHFTTHRDAYTTQDSRTSQD